MWYRQSGTSNRHLFCFHDAPNSAHGANVHVALDPEMCCYVTLVSHVLPRKRAMFIGLGGGAQEFGFAWRVHWHDSVEGAMRHATFWGQRTLVRMYVCTAACACVSPSYVALRLPWLGS